MGKSETIYTGIFLGDDFYKIKSFSGALNQQMPIAVNQQLPRDDNTYIWRVNRLGKSETFPIGQFLRGRQLQKEIFRCHDMVESTSAGLSSSKKENDLGPS